jgi:hypothetical protein
MLLRDVWFLAIQICLDTIARLPGTFMMQVQEDLMPSVERNEATLTREQASFRGFHGAGRLGQKQMILLKSFRLVAPIAVVVAWFHIMYRAIPIILVPPSMPTTIQARPYQGSISHAPTLSTDRAPTKMKKTFRPLPKGLTVRVQLVPQKEQRYNTLGDWIWRGSQLNIRLSREFAQQDPRYGVLLVTHELVEALLCRSAGISTGQVDAFDMAFRGDGEPGDEPSAPYHRQHRMAEAAERALAGELGVRWRQYLGG